MKPETNMSREGKTRIVEDDRPPLKITFYKEWTVPLEENERAYIRQLIATVEIYDDWFQLTAQTKSELLEMIARLLQAYTEQ